MGEIDYPKHLEKMWQKVIAPREPNAPTVISTFAGGGGSLTGYLMAGYRELLAVEWDDNAVETLQLNYPHLNIYHGDIAKLSVDETLERTMLQVGELDVLDGSPPCQGFSTAGKRKLDDDRNQLFKEYVRLLRGLKPKVFVMENVSGLVKGKMKLVFAEIMRELKASDYKVKCRLLNAKYFHVPQSRERLIFIGVRGDLGVEPSYPKAESYPIPLREICPGALGSKSQQINQDISSKYPHCTIQKASFLRKTIHISGGRREPTSKELSLLGSFPIQYQFLKNSQWQIIGNSVPPLMMEAIVRHIKIDILDRLSEQKQIL